MPGSVKKRGRNSYRIRFNLPPDPATGKRRQYSETVRGTKKDAEKRLACLIADLVQNGYHEDTTMTLKEYMQSWLEKYRRGHRDTTYDVTEGLVRCHIVRVLGDTLLRDLTPSQVADLVEDMLDQGLAPRTAAYAHWILKTALTEAVDLDMIRENVAARVKPPRDTGTETRPLTELEVEAFFRAAAGSRLFAAFVVLLYTGIRRGELLGLRWEDVDFEHMLLHVQQALVKSRGKAQMTDGKTDNAKRGIPLSPVLIEVLKQHKARQEEERLKAGSRWQDTGLVFTTKKGTAVYPDNLTSRYLVPILKRAGLVGIHPHQFRHTFATWAIMNGVDVKQVAEWMGHYDASFTWRRYHHLMPGRNVEQDAMRLGGAVFGKVSDQLVTESRASGI